MKIGIKYNRAACRIIVRIIIFSEGDFKSRYIFRNIWDFPTNAGWELKSEGTKYEGTNYIVDSFKTSEEAEAWAVSQITALKEKLNQWRDTKIPDSYEIEI
jgi:hypothetical protein